LVSFTCFSTPDLETSISRQRTTRVELHSVASESVTASMLQALVTTTEVPGVVAFGDGRRDAELRLRLPARGEHRGEWSSKPFL
jgi:hypothetical protein